MECIRFSYVFPIYNEEEVLPELLTAVRELLGNEVLAGCTEIILVDDGSTDRSWAMIADVATMDKRFVAVRLSRNFGHQYALTAGYSLAKGEAVICMDSDLQDPPEVSLQLIEKWVQGNDIVYAVRSSREGETCFKLWTANLFYRLYSAIGESKEPMNAGDFRLMSRRAVDAFLRLPEHHRYIRGLIGWLGFKTETVEFVRRPRVAGKTKYPLSKMMRFALDAVVSMSSVPLRFAYFAAFMGTTLFLGYLLYNLFYAYVLNVRMLPGWTSLIISIVAFGALNLICIGLVGEYVGRIYQEVKNRPLYLLSDVISEGAAQRLSSRPVDNEKQ